MAACVKAAHALGKGTGGEACGETYDFAGNFKTKGCYGHTSGKWANCIFYGLIGDAEVTSEDELNALTGNKFCLLYTSDAADE